MIPESKIPGGPLESKWERHKGSVKLVNPSNKRKRTLIVAGSGLAGASAAASLGELGYTVLNFCLQDSPRRAHSIAAQGGINAAKNYRNDGDNVWRLFHDTIKGGDFRAREANVFRLAEVSAHIIDHCTALGVPFAREYGGHLSNRSFGGAQVSRTFFSRGQTGQQLLLGAYGAMMRQVADGAVKLFPRREMLDLVIVEGRARGIVCRNLIDGRIERHAADAVLLATGGYGRAFYLSTNAMNSNGTALWRCHKRGALIANPCFTQIHPTCIPQMGEDQSKLTLMSESLRNDGRVWVPKNPHDTRAPNDIPESERDYYLERRYPSFGNLVPRDIASRAAKTMCDEGRGVGPAGLAVYLDFSDAMKRLGKKTVEQRYGNLFAMYREIMAEDPYETPMKMYPAPHYMMGGLWVDYNLMTTIPGLFAIGEANFSDHGANRLGASALMQGLADGYFIIPYMIGHYLAGTALPAVSTDAAPFVNAAREVEAETKRMLAVNGRKTARRYHQEIGKILWDRAGLSREEAGLKSAIEDIRTLRDEFRENVKVAGRDDDFNKHLEIAGRVSDYLELAETIARDALAREESCGCHLRLESRTEEGEARRDDERFSHVAVWEYKGKNAPPERHIEPLTFENLEMSQRSYK